MTELTNEQIEQILHGSEWASTHCTESGVYWFIEEGVEIYINETIYHLDSLREILSLRQEVERLRSQKCYFEVSYMDNVMGAFLSEQDAIDYSNKFGGVYAIEQISFGE